MKLAKETTVKLNRKQANIVGHLCYAAFKLWNVCLYERRNWRTLSLTEYPTSHESHA